MIDSLPTVMCVLVLLIGTVNAIDKLFPSKPKKRLDRLTILHIRTFNEPRVYHG